MALWKLFRGSRADLDAVEKHDGYIYFCDNGTLFFDYTDADGNLQRKQINAKEAESLIGCDITPEKIASWDSAAQDISNIKPAIIDVAALPEHDVSATSLYRTAKSIGVFHMTIEEEAIEFPATVYYVDTLPETGIETKAENLLTDGYHIYKQKEDNLTYVYSLDDVDNTVKWSAADFLIVDTVEELNGEDGIVISESVNSIYTRNSENTDWVQLLSAGDAYTKAEVDEITTGLNTRLDEFYTEVLDEENQNSLKNEIPDLYNYVDGGFTNVWDFVNTLDGDVATLYNDKLDKVTEESQYERVYVADVDGTQTVENLVHDSALKWSIPRRNAYGQVVVGEPTSEKHATTKKYVDNKVQRLFGTTEYVEETVYYDESKLTYSDYVNGCEYDYNAHAISMIFNDSDFAVNIPIYIKFQVSGYSATYHAYGYIYKSSDGQIYIGDQAINTDADAALYMYKVGNEIHVIMYLPDSSSSYFNAYASTPFTVSYDESYTSDEIIPEKLLYVTKEIEIYDTVKEAERAQTATTATTASTATKASQDSNGYSFTTYYTKAPSSNPLSISGNNLQVKYTKGNNTTSSYSIDLSKVTAVTNALSSATVAANTTKELIGYEAPGELVTFDEAALSYENSYENCYFTNSYFYIRLARSDIEANKDKPIYIRIKEGSQIEDYTIIYSPDNADAEERSPYITAYASEGDIGSTYWYENASYIALSRYPIAGYGGYVTAVASCNIPIEIVDQYNYDREHTAWLQEISLEKIEKFTPAACAKGLLAEDGVSRVTFEDIKDYVDDTVKKAGGGSSNEMTTVYWSDVQTNGEYVLSSGEYCIAFCDETGNSLDSGIVPTIGRLRIPGYVDAFYLQGFGNKDQIIVTETGDEQGVILEFNDSALVGFYKILRVREMPCPCGPVSCVVEVII